MCVSFKFNVLSLTITCYREVSVFVGEVLTNYVIGIVKIIFSIGSGISKHKAFFTYNDSL